MLRLAGSTSRAWVDEACAHVPELLVDHAQCEKKAASTALNLMFRYPDKPELLTAMSALAREELEHFDLVLDAMTRRDIEYAHQTPAPYAKQLMKAIRPIEPARLLDTLLVCALIEARSCERMKLLAEALDDAELASLYAGLLASEARHHALYVDLALGRFARDEVFARLAELAAHELTCLGLGGPLRVHS